MSASPSARTWVALPKRELLASLVIQDIEVPLINTFTRLRPPNLDHQVTVCMGHLSDR